jgi:hypothetical protein
MPRRVKRPFTGLPQFARDFFRACPPLHEA